MKNAIKQRLPKTAEKRKLLEEKFINDTEKNSFESLSLDDLVKQFQEIEQQGQLMQGQILLEARSRFAGDREFGQWCAQSLCLGSQPQRTRLMNLARYFNKGRPMSGISVTAGYEISSPSNADIADSIYNEVLGKNFSIAEIKEKIAQKKPVIQAVENDDENEPIPVRIIPTDKPLIIGKPIEEKQEITDLSGNKTKYDLIMDILEGLTGGEAKKLLRDCMHAVKW